jgi:acyl-CoA dehydrogenase
MCGGLGVAGDTPIARYMSEIRPFRIYDGPTETHKWAIARRALRERISRTA